MGFGQPVPKDSPLTCVLKNLKPLALTELKANRLKQPCTQIWPQYQLDNQDLWLEVGTFDFNILQNLTNFLKWNGKWSEVPYAQAFWALRRRPSLCKACSTHEVLLCALPPKQKDSSSSTSRREPAREIPPMAKVMRKSPDRQRKVRTQGTPHSTHDKVMQARTQGVP